MKKTLLLLAAIAILASCSAPKYSYNFDHYNYNSGKKKAASSQEISSAEGIQPIQPELLTASASPVVEPTLINPPAEQKTVKAQHPLRSMSKTERKEVMSSIKAAKKIMKAEKKSTNNAAGKGMDHDLKLAAIFGAVGIVALIISGNVFYVIGGIALIIGVVFFVKWLINQ